MSHRSGLRRYGTLFALLLGMATPLSAFAQNPYPVLITRFETTKAPANPAQYVGGEEITVYFEVPRNSRVCFILTNPDGDRVYGDWFMAQGNLLYRLDGTAIGQGFHTLTAVVEVGVPGVGLCEVRDLQYEVVGPLEAEE